MSRLSNYIKRGVRYVLYGQPIVVHKVVASIATLSPNDLLKGRTALITGGTSGIGYAIGKAFVNAGADVVITSREKERAQSKAKRLYEETGGRVYGCALDNAVVEHFDDVLDYVYSIVPSHKIDILVNNAGILGGEISKVSSAEYNSIMDTNLKGAFFLSKIVASRMIEANIQGNILNIASSSSLRPAISVYTMSKWGLRGLTLGLAKSLAPMGIVVNGIAPGPTATPMLKISDDNIYREASPMKRYSLASEIANMAVVLTSDLSRTVVGDIVYMTGGAGLITFDDVEYKF